MIRRHVGIAVVLSVLAAGLVVTGCGDDETSTPPTPQPEAGVDATPDQSTTDAKPDTTQEAAADVVSEQAEDVVQGDVTPDVAPDVAPEADAPPPPPSGVIQLLTINDFHGQLDPVEVTLADGVSKAYYGGLGYLSTYFKAEKAANPNTIILNGGDEIGASPTLSAFGTPLPDEPSVLALRYLGLTASNLGNHNFDRGTSHLKKIIELAADGTLAAPYNTPYRYVGTNIKDPASELGDKLIKPYHMIELAGIKVAIIGISNTETPGIVAAGSMGTVTIEQPTAAANAAATAARAAGAHVVLGTAHIGANTKDPTNPDKYAGPLIQFVKQLQGFDFVQGGHTEAEFFEQEANGTWVAQGPGRGHAYYKVLLTVTDGAVTNVEIKEVAAIGRETKPLQNPGGPDAGLPEGGLNCSTADCPTGFTCLVQSKPICEKIYIDPDPAVPGMLKGWKDGLAVRFDVPIGKIDAVWKRDGSLERSREVPLGDMVADAILEAYKPWGAQIAFMNGGGIRDSLPSAYTPKDTNLKRTGCTAAEPCDLVVGDVYAVVPFGNAAVLRELSGKTIKLLLEHSLGSLPVPPGTFHGKFQQVAGMEFTWDSAEPVDARVSNMLLVDNTTTPPTKTAIDGNNDTVLYKVIVNDFMNGGGDKFEMLIEEVPTPAMGILADAVLDYIKKEHAAGRSVTAACPGLYLTPEQPCRIHPLHWPL